MWTTKEVLLISIATSLATFFSTFYVQKRFASYIDGKVQAKTGDNPLLGLTNNSFSQPISIPIYNKPTEPSSFGQMQTIATPELQFHPSPPGSGKKWTPLPIS